MQFDLFEYTSTDDSCSQIFLRQADRFIFWIGGACVMTATLILIIGSFRFRELRKQPGDLILGIAFSDFILALHWFVLATFYESVNNETFCKITGAFGTLAGIGEYLYAVAFSLFLIVSLRNALKQAKIPKKTFHFVCIGLAITLLVVLFLFGKIGKTMVGTCSIASKCNGGQGFSFTNLVSPLIVLSYTIVATYTYRYIRKNAPKCASAHSKRTQFLMYYLKYIKASIVIYTLIAITNFLSTLLYANLPIMNSIYNFMKLCSPLVLTFIRYNDPFIKKIMIKTVKFWRKRTMTSSSEDPFVESDDTDQEQDTVIHKGVTASVDNRRPNESYDDGNNEFIFNDLSSGRKIEITYTLLSCVLYANHNQRNSTVRDPVIASDKNAKNPYKHERVYLIDDDTVKGLLPSVREELKNEFSVLPGTLKVYAPEVFRGFVNDEKDYLDIQESLDFKLNKEQINDASGPGGGKSGEFFFFSRDKKLIVKTVPDVEMAQIGAILERYEEHYKTYPNSLIAKIYGAFTFASSEFGMKFNLIVMKNINGFPSKYVERTYDMKGSTYDREVFKGRSMTDRTMLKGSVLKDLDFEKYERKLYIREDMKQEFLKQIEADSMFFRRVKLIDYSFMVFCVNKKKYFEENQVLNDAFTSKNKLGSLENVQEEGVFYNVGIVDYLQPYNFGKAMEKVLKKVKKLDAGLDTSSQDPQYYSKRFIIFIRKLVDAKEESNVTLSLDVTN